MRIRTLLTILLTLSLAACDNQLHVDLMPRLLGPAFPPFLIQSQGCSNGSSPWPGTPITCSFPKPALPQDRVLVIAYNSGTSLSITDDGGDAFAQMTSPAFIPNSAAGLYFYSTVTQGTQAITVQGYPTLSAVAILDLSGGAFVDSAPATAYYTNGCGSGWSCDFSPFPFRSGTVPIAKSSILIGVQAGIASACTNYSDPAYGCKGWGAGFTVLYSQNGSFGACVAGCGFTVETTTTAVPVAAPFITSIYNPPSIPVNAAWAAEEIAIQ